MSLGLIFQFIPFPSALNFLNKKRNLEAFGKDFPLARFMNVIMSMNLKNNDSFLKQTVVAPLLLAFLLVLTACGKSSPAPFVDAPSMIEESIDGEEIIEREFSECAEGESASENPMDYVQIRQNSSHPMVKKQISVQEQFPLLYSSLEKSFPLRGSWRKTKAEILDLVHRYLWSPEQNKPVPMLGYFDMVLLVNVSARSPQSPETSSAQRMQILVRDGASNHLDQWKRIHVWPISSGNPCARKVETPTGVFKLDPARFHPEYYSKQFDNIEMFETMFLHHRYQSGKLTGIAIHGTYLTEKLGRRDSGGCIRLLRENSQCLFNTIRGDLKKSCLDGGYINYRGTVPSFMDQNGEADPHFLSNNQLEIEGYKVLVAIYKDSEDLL